MSLFCRVYLLYLLPYLYVIISSIYTYRVQSFKRFERIIFCSRFDTWYNTCSLSLYHFVHGKYKLLTAISLLFLCPCKYCMGFIHTKIDIYHTYIHGTRYTTNNEYLFADFQFPFYS